MECPSKKVSYDGKGVEVEASINNQGWPSIDGSNMKKFEGRRKNIPKPLCLDRTSQFTEENILLRESKVSMSQPGFDWGLGCFGNATKIVETGKGETAELAWTDFHEVRTAKEFARDKRGFRDDGEWIHLQRLYQTDAKEKSELDLIDFHRRGEKASQVDSHQAAFQDESNGKYHEFRFLADLDNLESARPDEQNEVQNVTSSIVSTTRRPRVFMDWIEEADFMEANSTMAQGTRYYSAP
ncbi:hypothetical protein F4821DRAFT_226692 [Hypoxylon rubiginosum]|uniref:Uncharacterized protein n=1 Tax=Hypoxylon rubiginosum TaxID=110542 RepID=A0ACC0DG18_9PEZI|nr:hypothetical protein F4821DRAFT_226692 [Hypoxylon rubiginosum]